MSMAPGFSSGMAGRSYGRPIRSRFWVARFEARTAERLEEIRGEVEDWLKEQGIHV